MSNIHYFQRYSQKENAVTNNTLQLIGRLYEYSIPKLNEFLISLFGEEVGLGISIEQQTKQKGNRSIPDGQIAQQSFKILLESKVDADPRPDQLVSHCDSFNDEKLKILVMPTKRVDNKLHKEIQSRIKEKDASIIFKWVTYEEICKALNGLFKEHENEILDIIEDYQNYCRETGLMDDTEFLMRIVPVGTSFDLNKQYHIYFRPSDCGYTEHRYIGLYKDKAIKCLIKIISVFDVKSDDKNFQRYLIQGEETDKFDDKIKGIIREAKSLFNWDIARGHRFFCSDETFDTSFQKSTPYGIRGPRFINLKQIEGLTKGAKGDDLFETKEIAERLKSKTWS